MPGKTRPDRNSTKALLRSFATAGKYPEIPDGCGLETEAEMTLWRQFMGTRCIEDWREIDLVLVSKAIKIEVEIRAHKTRLEAEGTLLETERGLVEHPLFKIIDVLQKQQLSILRSMSLTKHGSDSRTLADNGKARKAAHTKAAESDDLLAARAH
jgi:hypothetical protein